MVLQVQAISIEPMHRGDLEAVMRLDKVCFRSPWLAESYVTELGNRAAQYFAVRIQGEIVGYGGVWAIDHEAHITTLAVSPEYRRRGIGERLLISLLQEAIIREARRVTLEVRIGNTAARTLYNKYCFTYVERRTNYYTDNGEDAIIMRVDNVDLPIFSHMLAEAMQRLSEQR